MLADADLISSRAKPSPALISKLFALCEFHQDAVGIAGEREAIPAGAPKAPVSSGDHRAARSLEGSKGGAQVAYLEPDRRGTRIRNAQVIRCCAAGLDFRA